jgi:hypothetical protein
MEKAILENNKKKFTQSTHTPFYLPPLRDEFGFGTQASLSMQRVGVPKTIIKCLFTTLQEAIHKVQTGFGDSKSHCGGKVWLVPIHGIGQGNGAGPAIWAVVSTPLLNVLREKDYGCDIVCPLSSSFFKFVGCAFMDDTNVIQLSLTETPDQARMQLQNAIGTWEFNLKATCDALVPEKTVLWLVSFKWEGGSWRYAGMQDSPGEVWVNDLYNDRKVLKRLEPHQAYKTLGVFLAPDGNLSKQFNKMRAAAVEWADGIHTGNLRKEEVWIALQSTVLRTLAYPLPALRLTRSSAKQSYRSSSSTAWQHSVSVETFQGVLSSLHTNTWD